MTSYLSKSSQALLRWSGTGYSAFTSFEATKNYLSVTYIRYDDVIVYNYTIWKNHSAEIFYEDEDDDDTIDAEEPDQNQTNKDKLNSSGDQSSFIHFLRFSFAVITKVLGVSLIVVAAISLFVLALYFVYQRSTPSSPRITRGTLSPKGAHKKKSKKGKKNIGFHSLPVQEEDEESKDPTLQLSTCNEEINLLTSSLHSPRPSSMSLPYPKGVTGRNHKKIKSMPSLGNP